MTPAEMKFNDLMIYGSCFAKQREVCARRARKLRKRRESVKFSRNTQNGKARYVWECRIPPEKVLTYNKE